MAANAEVRRIGGAEAEGPPVILASKSSSRRRMLADAGVPHSAEAAQVDEAEIKLALQRERATPAEIAETLAELKAQRLSLRNAGALVVGADQVLECNGVMFDKPADMDQAAGHLAALSARRHTLIASACVVRDGTRIWHYQDRATLQMRPLSEAFIAAYLAAVGERARDSVGAYQLEGLGAQLFTRVEGDFFTVLGLPLLPLLDFLRNHKVLMT
ncbi:MAG: Maf family protein [Rhodovibrionaceae bacterium]|nr:Maf family protein [Rhodovibrionaceae bacterium]